MTQSTNLKIQIAPILIVSKTSVQDWKDTFSHS